MHRLKILFWSFVIAFVIITIPMAFATVNETNWYTFEGILTDNGTAGYDLSVEAGDPETYTTGKVGDESYTFEGGDRLVNTQFGGTADNITFCAWVNLSNSDSDMMILAFTESGTAISATMFQQAAGTFGVGCDGTQRELTIAAGGFEGTYFHACAVCQLGDFMKLYINGSLEKTDTVTLGTSPEILSLHIGSRAGNSQFFTGDLDDIRFFINTSNDTIDIAALYNSGLGRDTSLNFTAPAPPDSCTYVSGDWIIDTADNCEVDTATDVGGNDIFISGNGEVTFRARVVNFGRIIVNAGATLICRITGTGCFGG